MQRRVALISFHACPLASPGEGKSGGMNVYVSQLSRSLNKLGIEVDIFTRDHHGPHTSYDYDLCLLYTSPSPRD